jgi:FtsH-binding integral membrane protein
MYSGSSLYNRYIKNQKFKGGNKIMSINNLFELFQEKKVFLLKVFSTLIFQLLITFIIFFKVKTTLFNKPINFILLILGTFIILGLLAFVPMHPILKLILLTLFSSLIGLLLASSKDRFSPTIIKTALIGVLSIFVLMFSFGLLLIIFNIKLGNTFGLILLFALLVLIIVTIVLQFMDKFSVAQKGIAIAGLIIFSIYIVYDTNIILQRDSEIDFITASINYYLDIINIFNDLLLYQSS